MIYTVSGEKKGKDSETKILLLVKIFLNHMLFYACTSYAIYEHSTQFE